jgi:hypothetical protein
MTHDNRQPDRDALVTAALRDIYAPPADPAYWAGLEARVLARVRAEGVEAPEWWQLLGGWARAGALAAGITALAAGAALLQTRAAEARAAYAAVVETTPAIPLAAVARGAEAPAEGREATLRYVITH